MTNMIERVARAIAKENNTDAAFDLPWEFFSRQARAAVEAMKETTPQMRVAVRQAGGPQALAYANAAWPTMIDAALKEES